MKESTFLIPLMNNRELLPLIRTDLTESEALVKGLAKEVKAALPGEFAGRQSCVYYKVSYVPPFENFRELRRLILRVREATGLRADFRGLVALDVTEWVGHEREEFFTVLLKYLYDHRYDWRAALVVNCSREQLQRLAAACVHYITPRVIDATFFERRERLEEAVRDILHREGKQMTAGAWDLLLPVLLRRELMPVRSLTFLERIGEELAQAAEGARRIDEPAMRRYLLNPDSTLTMLCGNGRALCKEKEDEK